MADTRKFDRSWGGGKWLFDAGAVDRSLGQLHVQTMHILLDGIRRSQIPQGARMPSSRAIADVLGISRNTAKLAIEGLVEQGVLSARDRSGTYVAAASPSPAVAAGQIPATGSVDWNRRFTLALNPAIEVPVARALKASFLYGQFDASVFPAGRWRECERAALSVAEIQSWGKDVVDEDDPLLVEQLREQVLPRHGILARADNILITLGGQQGRYLVSQLFGATGTTTGIEHPGMPDIAKILALSPTRRRPLQLDRDGVVLGEQLRGCDTVFVTCGHQCPTTAVMPLERRRALLEQAVQDDFIVVEDTFETELFTQPEHLPALKAMPGSERVIHVASLSKLIAPGLRLGYVVAEPPVIAQMRALRRLIHRHPPGNNQRALAIFIERGYHRAFLRRAKAVMGEREHVMAEALDRYFPGSRWRHCPGASTFWMKLPEGAGSEDFCRQAAMQGVLVETGTRYFYAGAADGEYLRLSVSSIPAVRIADGVRRLATAFREQGPLPQPAPAPAGGANWNR